ncbi:MAG: response regulator [Sulfitobacter sp.]
MKILAVDDDEIILDLLTEILTSLGYSDLTTARSAADAYHAISSADVPYDCILLDIQMPVTDGIAFCGAIRGLKDYVETPVVMITAMSDKKYIDNAFQAGATDYVTKPFDVTELSTRVRLAERLSEDQKKRRAAENLLPATFKRTDEEKADLDLPISIRDVDCVIDYVSMENYLAQLSRSALFGSCVIAFKINDVEQFHDSMTNYEFACTVTDVAEAITIALVGRQHLISYAGAGVYTVVLDSLNGLDLPSINARIKQAMFDLSMCYSDGRPLYLSMTHGAPVRLTLRSGLGAIRALKIAIGNARLQDYQTTANGNLAQQMHGT